MCRTNCYTFHGESSSIRNRFSQHQKNSMKDQRNAVRNLETNRKTLEREKETHEDIESRPTTRETTFGFLELFCCLTPGLDWTRLFMSLTAGAGTRCMSLLPTSPILCLTHASLGTVPARLAIVCQSFSRLTIYLSMVIGRRQTNHGSGTSNRRLTMDFTTQACSQGVNLLCREGNSQPGHWMSGCFLLTDTRNYPFSP